ncbi:Uncharacterised protein [Chlamydia trachomatis]|nr:Uncharacterised protein [Chlamydia trachomatis]
MCSKLCSKIQQLFMIGSALKTISGGEEGEGAGIDM